MIDYLFALVLEFCIAFKECLEFCLYLALS